MKEHSRDHTILSVVKWATCVVDAMPHRRDISFWFKWSEITITSLFASLAAWTPANWHDSLASEEGFLFDHVTHTDCQR